MKRTRRSYRGAALLLALLLLSLSAFYPGCSRGKPASTGPTTRPATSAPESQAQDQSHYTFIVCGDPQNNYEVFDKILEAAKSVDFLIIAGDLTGSGTRTEFENFTTHMKNSGVRYYCIPGNHDVATGPVGDIYSSYLGAPHRSFDYQNSHFALIDNSTPALGFYPQERAWVKADLDQASKRGYGHIFAVCHVPPHYPYSAKADETQVNGINANKELIPLLSTEHVEELFCGHIHGYDEDKEGGVLVTITGGAGAPLLEAWGPNSFYNYILVEINGKQRVQKVVRI